MPHDLERDPGGDHNRLRRSSGKLGELHVAECVWVDVSIVSGQRLGPLLPRHMDDCRPHEDVSAPN